MEFVLIGGLDRSTEILKNFYSAYFKKCGVQAEWFCRTTLIEKVIEDKDTYCQVPLNLFPLLGGETGIHQIQYWKSGQERTDLIYVYCRPDNVLEPVDVSHAKLRRLYDMRKGAIKDSCEDGTWGIYPTSVLNTGNLEIFYKKTLSQKQDAPVSIDYMLISSREVVQRVYNRLNLFVELNEDVEIETVVKLLCQLYAGDELPLPPGVTFESYEQSNGEMFTRLAITASSKIQEAFPLWVEVKNQNIHVLHARLWLQLTDQLWVIQSLEKQGYLGYSNGTIKGS